VPGKDRFAPDHPVVRQHPEKFALVWNVFSRGGREALRLERELRAIERAMRTAPPATPTPAPKPAATTTPTPLFGPVGGHRAGHVRRRRRSTATPTWRL
jgi:hypothetical protein